MSVWVLADLHLAFGAPDKSMEVFGPRWKDYPDKIYQHWNDLIKPGDLVLIPGDISWALHLEKAMIDLNWIHALPGTKVMIKGNHDYWWSAVSKIKKVLPPSMHIIHNDAFHWNDFSFAGSRLWDNYEFDFDEIIPSYPCPELTVEAKEEQEKIFTRELGRLELSLKAMDQKVAHRIALTHYPPVGLDLKPSRTSVLLEKYNVDTCVFGHLHGLKDGCKDLFGQARGINYVFAAADYLQFVPIKLF